MSGRVVAICAGCGKPLSFHDGSGRWNHVSTEDAGRCEGPKRPRVAVTGRIDDVLADPRVEYDREDYVCVAYDDLYDLRERVRSAEDFRAEIALEAFTAPDADWSTILDSLRARIRDLIGGIPEDGCYQSE